MLKFKTVVKLNVSHNHPIIINRKNNSYYFTKTAVFNSQAQSPNWLTRCPQNLIVGNDWVLYRRSSCMQPSFGNDWIGWTVNNSRSLATTERTELLITEPSSQATTESCRWKTKDPKSWTKIHEDMMLPSTRITVSIIYHPFIGQSSRITGIHGRKVEVENFKLYYSSMLPNQWSKCHPMLQGISRANNVGHCFQFSTRVRGLSEKKQQPNNEMRISRE